MGIGNNEEWSLEGADDREMVEALLSTKCYVASSATAVRVPFGYESASSYVGVGGTQFDVYRNRYALPLGYTYSKSIDQATYDSLTMLQKQQALLQGVVVNSPTANGVVNQLDDTHLQYADESLDYTVTVSDEMVNNISDENGRIEVKKAKSSIDLTFACPAGKELYCSFAGLQYQPSAADPLNCDTSVQIACNGITKQFLLYMPRDSGYSNRHDFLVSMVNSNSSRTTMTLTFKAAGTYTFDSLGVSALDLSAYPDRIE